MKTNPLKDQEQKKAIQTWFARGYRGTLELCTSFGKTLTAIKAALFLAEENPELKVLILAPTEVIRDDIWQNEFKKWGKVKFYKENCTTECIQTAYKWSDTHWDLVICDEIHNYLSEEYSKFFANNKIDKIMGLSAKIPNERVHILADIAPIIYRMTIAQAVELGIVSPYKIYNLTVELTGEELSKYRSINKSYAYYEMLLGGRFDAFTKARDLLGDDNAGPEEKKWAGIFFGQMRARKTLLHNAANKINLTHQLIDKFGVPTIAFSETKDFSELLCRGREDIVFYHSGMSTKDRKEAIKRFQDKRTKVNTISAVRALNEGWDVPSLSLAVVCSGTSKSKEFIQRVGRAVRFEDDKKAVIVNLCCKGTQEDKWVASRTKGFSVIEVDTVEEISI